MMAGGHIKSPGLFTFWKAEYLPEIDAGDVEVTNDQDKVKLRSVKVWKTQVQQNELKGGHFKWGGGSRGSKWEDWLVVISSLLIFVRVDYNVSSAVTVISPGFGSDYRLITNHYKGDSFFGGLMHSPIWSVLSLQGHQDAEPSLRRHLPRGSLHCRRSRNCF